MGLFSFFKAFDRSLPASEEKKMDLHDEFDFSNKAEEPKKAEEKSAPAPEFPPRRGHFDGCGNAVAAGWAFYTGDVNTPVELMVHIDGELVGTILAEHPRADLTKNNIGNGKCAFRFEIPEAYIDGSEHIIEVSYKDSGLAMNNSPQRHEFKRKA